MKTPSINHTAKPVVSDFQNKPRTVPYTPPPTPSWKSEAWNSRNIFSRLYNYPVSSVCLLRTEIARAVKRMVMESVHPGVRKEAVVAAFKPNSSLRIVEVQDC